MFATRADAGVQLAARLVPLGLERPVVLALPRGGVPVAAEVAVALHAPLDVLLVRKLGAPMHSELAIGAVVDGTPPQTVLNDMLLQRLAVSERYIVQHRDAALAEIERRRRLYCGNRSGIDVHGRTAIVVDDGVATGMTAQAALIALARQGAARRILATPVIAPETARMIEADGVDVVAVAEPEDFLAVGQFYRDFHQLEDDEVIAILHSFQV